MNSFGFPLLRCLNNTNIFSFTYTWNLQGKNGPEVGRRDIYIYMPYICLNHFFHCKNFTPIPFTLEFDCSKAGKRFLTSWNLTTVLRLSLSLNTERFYKRQGHATFEALCWLFCGMADSRNTVSLEKSWRKSVFSLKQRSHLLRII